MHHFELIGKIPTDTKQIKRIKEYTPRSILLDIYSYANLEYPEDKG